MILTPTRKESTIVLSLGNIFLMDSLPLGKPTSAAPFYLLPFTQVDTVLPGF